MTNEGRELYEFGPFRLDPEKRLLLRDNEPVPLQLKAFDTLLVLVRNSQQVVLKDELMKAVWPDTFVEEANLAQNIFVLRKTLSANSGLSDNQRYITTVPGRGYRFAESVRLVDPEALIVQRRTRTHLLIEEKTAQQPVPAPIVVAPQPASHRQSTRLTRVAALLMVLALAAFWLRPAVREPRVTGIHQITHIGSLVHNTHLITDGPRIYFRVWHGPARDFASVSTAGGEVSPVNIPLPLIDIDDISPDDSEFLVENYGNPNRVPGSADSQSGLWRVPVPTGSPRPTGLRTHEAAWSPDGRTIAYSRGTALFQANIDGTHSTQIAALPDEAFYLRWAPDGRHIRFSAGDSKTTGNFLWEADLITHSVRKLLPGLPPSARPWSGGWTPDGKYFFYSAVNNGTRNLYAIREKPGLLRRSDSSPIALTNGPFNFYVPLPGRDGKRLFVVGDQLRGAFLRYDPATKQFSPYAPSLSADHVAFSPDGQWMAYIEFPEDTLVRSRLDGSQRLQLTYPPMRAFDPQWSPDGTQIAFDAAADTGTPRRIFFISASGGIATPVIASSTDRQVYPSWKAGGTAIVFSNSDPAQSTLNLRMVDVKTREVAALPGTDGLTYGQISPDGRSIIAVDFAAQALVLYDVGTHTRRILADTADYPRWSRDGKSVYFNRAYFHPKGREDGVYRWYFSTNKIEMLVRYPDIALTGAYGISFSPTPDGSVLFLKDASNRDLYAIDLDLP